MTITARATSPAHVLAMVPELVGFEPTDGLVLIGLARGSCCAALRIGPPPPGGSRASGLEIRFAVAARAVDAIVRVEGTDAMTAIVYTSESSRPVPPEHDLVERVAGLAVEADLRLRDRCYVACDGWGGCGCAPRPLDELVEERMLRGLDPDAHDLGEDPAAAVLADRGAFECERTARGLEVLRTAAARGDGGIDPARVDPLWFARYSATWDPTDLGPSTAALMAFMLEREDSRDVLLAAWGWGEERGRATLAFIDAGRVGREPEPLDDPTLMLMGQGELPRPSAVGIERMIALLREVAARLPRRERAPVLTALAWLSWAIGRSSIAERYAELAGEGARDAEFASMLLAVLDLGMRPDWAHRSSVQGTRSQRRRRPPTAR